MTRTDDKKSRQYGDAFEFWWSGESFPPIDASWAARKHIAWEAWKASAARSTEAPPADPSGDLEILRMALGNTATCLGDALATYNRFVGKDVFVNSAPSSAIETPRPDAAFAWPNSTRPVLVELLNGDMRINDDIEDAPLVTIQGHNGVSAKAWLEFLFSLCKTPSPDKDRERYRWLRGAVTDYTPMFEQGMCLEAMDEWIDREMKK